MISDHIPISLPTAHWCVYNHHARGCIAHTHPAWLTQKQSVHTRSKPRMISSSVKYEGSGLVRSSHYTIRQWFPNIQQSRLLTASRRLEKLLLPFIFDTIVFRLWWCETCSYPTAVLNERMWHFRGQNILWPLLHIFRGQDPLTPRIYAPGGLPVSVFFGSVIWSVIFQSAWYARRAHRRQLRIFTASVHYNWGQHLHRRIGPLAQRSIPCVAMRHGGISTALKFRDVKTCNLRLNTTKRQSYKINKYIKCRSVALLLNNFRT